jgi:hypothetical protein
VVAISGKTVHDIYDSPAKRKVSMDCHQLWLCILDTQDIFQMVEHITELLMAFIGKNTKYKTKNANSKMIVTENC